MARAAAEGDGGEGEGEGVSEGGGEGGSESGGRGGGGGVAARTAAARAARVAVTRMAVRAGQATLSSACCAPSRPTRSGSQRQKPMHEEEELRSDDRSTARPQLPPSMVRARLDDGGSCMLARASNPSPITAHGLGTRREEVPTQRA